MVAFAACLKRFATQLVLMLVRAQQCMKATDICDAPAGGFSRAQA